MKTYAEDKPSILVVESGSDLRDRLDLICNGSSNASVEESAENLLYSIYGCNSHIVALAKVQISLEEGKSFHLAFIENKTPDIDVLKLINDLWQVDSNLHIVLCNQTLSLTWQDIVETIGESDQLFILDKPFSELALRQMVHAVMRKWQLSKQAKNVIEFMAHQIHERTLQIEEANKNLHQSEKLAAVGQLAAGIAHEINTPAQYVGDNIQAVSGFFTSITGLLEFYRKLLIERGEDELLEHIREREDHEDLEYILEDAPLALSQALEGMEQIVKIVQAMKGFSHMGQTHSAMIDINLALENTLLVARNSYKYLADVETNFGDVPAIECYPGELNQVFLNILINAAHAIEDRKIGRGKITITTLATPTGVEIRFADTGNGIPEAIRDRIFDPFFTTKDIGRGTGQGLNIAYRIIHQQHNGTLSFDSNIGVGTTFYIHLNSHL